MSYFKSYDDDGIEITPFPVYFYMDWNKKTAEWRSVANKPPKSKIKFLTKIRWKDIGKDVSINVCSNYLPVSAHKFKLENGYSNVSMLKSHLQKCVRRTNPFKAIKTAYTLMQLDMQTFLRRMCIIAVEDAIPLEGFSMLMWFTAAYGKGLVMSDEIIGWCLGYVYSITNFDKYETHGHTEKLNLDSLQLYKLKSEQASLVYSLMFRKAFGGMKGDKFMLNWACQNWTERFMKNETEHISSLERSMIFLTPPEESFHPSEWVIAGIDFHCCPGIIGNIIDTYDEYTEDEVKNAIWENSSSITNKKNLITNEVQDKPSHDSVVIWKRISKKFYSLASFYLKVRS